MANPEHLAILKQGVKVWNEWREENLGIDPQVVDSGSSTRYNHNRMTMLSRRLRNNAQ